MYVEKSFVLWGNISSIAFLKFQFQKNSLLTVILRYIIKLSNNFKEVYSYGRKQSSGYF